MSFVAWVVFVSLTICGCGWLSRRVRRWSARAVMAVALVAPAGFSARTTRWVEAEVRIIQPRIAQVLDSISKSIVPPAGTTTSQVPQQDAS